MSGRNESGQVSIAMEDRTHTKKDSDLCGAVKENRLEDVKLLIQQGANPLYCKWEKNNLAGTGISTLESAIIKRNKPMVMALLSKGGPKDEDGGGAGEGAWEVDTEKLKDIKDCIVEDPNGIKISHRHTPFASLVDNLPDVAALVLDHCITPQGATHEEDYEISFDCSLLENKASNANKCYRGFPGAYICELLTSESSRSSRDDGCFDTIARENYDAYEKHHHPLYKIMQSNYPGLLKHPVVLALLEKKLNTFGWWLYYSNLLLYILLVSLLTGFILTLPNPQDRMCVQYRKLKGNASQAEAMDLDFFENLTSKLECSTVGLNLGLSALSGLKALALILTIVRFILELYQLYSRKLVGYFNDWVNWVELTEYIIIIVFLFNVERSECFCPQTWEWELGVVSLALSWVVLIAWLQVMHWIGIYVTILLRIIVSFARVAIFGVLLVVGFGLTFYLLFFQPPQNESVNVPSTFSSPLRSILSIILLTAGEFDTGGVFYSDGADSPSPGRQYESLGFIIWLACVIIMSVLFNNLLVGLAVGEVGSVLEEAHITTIKQRIELVLTQEEQFPEVIHKHLIQTKPIIVKPNKTNFILLIFLFFPLACSLVCSFICCNNNHVRYWKNILDTLGKSHTNKYDEISVLKDKTQLNSTSEIERGEGTPLTKQDLMTMEDKLNKRLKVMEDMLLEIKGQRKD